MYATALIPHLINDTVGGSPFLLSFCRRCSSGVGLDRVLEGQTLVFQVGGAYQGASLIRDDRTGTLWSSLTGQAMVGPWPAGDSSRCPWR